MSDNTGHIYRKRIESRDLLSFRVMIRETDLWISSDRELKKEARNLVFDYRHQIETYIMSHPEFLTTLKAYPEDSSAPSIVREMINATRGLDVGPMAAVAGAIAQFVAKGLLESAEQVIVENGGDIFLKVNREVIVSIYAGGSPLSEKIGLKIPVRSMPLGVCSSSGTVGHSLSLGSADLVCLTSSSAVLADAAATALGNRLKSKKDLKKVAAWAQGIDWIMGVLAIMDDRMATWGDIELVGL